MTDLLYIRHPSPDIHYNQVEMLNSLNEPAKSEMALLFRLGNASMHYYNTGDEPTEEDYLDWLSGLPAGIQDDMRKKGFESCKTILSLQRHALERKDIGMENYIRGLLNTEDYQYWKKHSKSE